MMHSHHDDLILVAVMCANLAIEPDVMIAVREMARQQSVAAGKAISRMVLQAPPGSNAGAGAVPGARALHHVTL